jgi:hypothetical protein
MTSTSREWETNDNYLEEKTHGKSPVKKGSGPS